MDQQLNLNPEKILQAGMAFWASKALLSAIEMGVFTELAWSRIVRCAVRTPRPAFPPGSRLPLVYEAIIDDDRSKNAFGLMMSLNMLIETPGGFDFTGSDRSEWMKEAGFSTTRVEHLVDPDSMVIAIK